jgi:CheY-like chemotaxis protein
MVFFDFLMATRILIIDDNVALTTLLSKTLDRFGYDPIVENNAIFAINTAREYRPDLILLDIMMPERDGGRVLADLRSDLSLRKIPVILLTAIAREVQSLADLGGIRSPVLSKPIKLQELIDEIERQIESSRTFHQQQSVALQHRGEGQAFSRPNRDTAIAPRASAFGDAMPRRLGQGLPPREPQRQLQIASLSAGAFSEGRDTASSGGHAFGQVPVGRRDDDSALPA